MASLNKKINSAPRTHGGAVAKRIPPEQILRRSVMSCFLWEKEFYEDGVSISERIMNTAAMCDIDTVIQVAVEARNVHGLRHVPLLLLLDLIKRGGPKVGNVINECIQRPDEIGELLTLYFGGSDRTFNNTVKGKMVPNQLKIGINLALNKFNEYSLAKYNRSNAGFKLKDALFMCHPEPKDKSQSAIFKALANDDLKTPDTWEVELSAGKDKKATFERLIKEGKLGYMALLRNLRNMEQAGCDRKLVADAIVARKGAKWVLPFRYTAAARHAPSYEQYIDKALCSAINELPQLRGRTIVLVDHSGSMHYAKISQKSELTRADAAFTLASILNAEDARIFGFANRVTEVAYRKGISGVDQLQKLPKGGTNLSEAVAHVNRIPHDRLIVITDEQNTSKIPIPDPVCEYPYMINVASYRNGVGYGKWTHIDGFSESVLKFINVLES